MEADWVKNKTVWVSTLRETLPPTPLDYTAPQNYIMHAWVFPFLSEMDRPAAVAYLKCRLRRVLVLMPCLAGQIIHANGDTDLPRLVHGKEYSLNLNLFPDEVFDCQVLKSSQFAWTFGELSALGVPAHTMSKDLFWLLPKSGVMPGGAYHPITLRASFIEGGLVLGFAFHHGVMDGSGTAELLKYFATNALDGIDTLAKRKLDFVTLAAETARNTPVNLRSMAGYDFNVPTSPPVLPPAVARILTFSASRIDGLHRAAMAVFHSPGPESPSSADTPFVSRTDVLCALVWLHVTRVRLRAGRPVPTDTTRFATAVDIRKKVDPAIGPGYVGNMWLRVMPDLIRHAVQTLDEPAVLRAHLAVATRATDPTDADLAWPEVDAAVRRAVARHSTGLDATVGVRLGADVEFNIPGLPEGKAKAAWVRRAYVANEGAMAVMPRRGGTKGGEDWEVWLAMREEDMDSLTGKRELGPWLSRAAA